jgi:hypothetical protein
MSAATFLESTLYAGACAEFPLAKSGPFGTLYSRLSDSLALPRHGKSSGELASVMI